MSAPVNYTAASAVAVMKQVIDTNIELVQNWEEGLDKRISAISAYDVGTEKFRAPVQLDQGGQVGGFNPDGGSLLQGTGPEYLQFVIVPVNHEVAITSTDLLNRISKGGGDRLIVRDVVSRLIGRTQKVMAHFRNCLLQGYNQGILATVDTSYTGGNQVNVSNPSFGARLLNLNNQYQVTDVNMNVLGVVTVLDKTPPSPSTVDTVTLDQVPASGSWGAGSFFIPLNYASSVPVGPAGLQYLITASQAFDQFGLERTLSQMQSPSVNAGGATVSLGVVDALDAKRALRLGVDAEVGDNFYYTNTVQRVTARRLGFAKVMIVTTDGKQPELDIAPGRAFGLGKRWTIGTTEVLEDSTAATDYLYNLVPSILGKARYPASMKFMTGPIEGFWYQRMINNLHTTTYDAHFQDSWQVYSRNPWKHAVAHGLGVDPSLALAA
jgi:hypothetical protein